MMELDQISDELENFGSGQRFKDRFTFIENKEIIEDNDKYLGMLFLLSIHFFYFVLLNVVTYHAE